MKPPPSTNYHKEHPSTHSFGACVLQRSFWATCFFALDTSAMATAPDASEDGPYYNGLEQPKRFKKAHKNSCFVYWSKDGSTLHRRKDNTTLQVEA